ncbi:MAG: MaoC family dehydratase [Cellvibrionaceae bacterium]
MEALNPSLVENTLKIRDRSSVKKTFSQRDVELFANLSGDVNPVHLDEDIATESIFKARVVHGMLVASLFSTIIGTQMPGPGAIYLGQNLKFKAPVFLGEEVEAILEVVSIRKDKPIATLKAVCRKQDGTVVIEGEAVVLLP